MKKLEGKKTYLSIAVGLVAMALQGLLAPETLAQWAGVLEGVVYAAFGGAALGRKVAKVGNLKDVVKTSVVLLLAFGLVGCGHTIKAGAGDKTTIEIRDHAKGPPCVVRVLKNSDEVFKYHQEGKPCPKVTRE